jgi:hypothetical protein
MFVVLCVLSGRGLCDGPIPRPEESYRLWCVLVCDHETSGTRRLKPERVVKCQIEVVVVVVVVVVVARQVSIYSVAF